MEDKKIAKKLWFLSYPTILSMAMESLYEIIDMIWIGKISAVAVSGVTLFVTMMNLFLIFNEIIGAASVSMISQAYGRGNNEKVRRVAEQTITFKVLMATISSVIFYFAFDPLLSFYTDDALVIQAARDYGFFRIYFLPITFASYSVNTIFRCTNDTKTPMKLMFLSAFLNTVLDPIFMFERVPFIGIRGFGMGVFGAAIATVFSTLVVFALGLRLLLKGHNNVRITWKGLFSLEPTIDKELIRIGIPAGIDTNLRMLAQAILVKFVSLFGTVAITAVGVCGTIFRFMLMPMFGFSIGGAAMVGQFLGQESKEEAKKVSHITSIMGSLIMCVFYLIVRIYSKEVMSLFIENNEVIAMGAELLKYGTFAFIIEGWNYGKVIAFSGSGYTFPLLVSGLLSKWGGQLGLCYIAINILGLGIEYVWWSYIVSAMVSLIVCSIFYKNGRWINVRV